MRTCSPEGYDFGIDRYINKIIIPNSVLQRVVEPVEEKKKTTTNQPKTNKQNPILWTWQHCLCFLDKNAEEIQTVRVKITKIIKMMERESQEGREVIGLKALRQDATVILHMLTNTCDKHVRVYFPETRSIRHIHPFSPGTALRAQLTPSRCSK